MRHCGFCQAPKEEDHFLFMPGSDTPYGCQAAAAAEKIKATMAVATINALMERTGYKLVQRDNLIYPEKIRRRPMATKTTKTTKTKKPFRGISTALLRFVNLPLTEYETTVDKMLPETRAALAAEVSTLLQGLAHAAGYLDWRRSDKGVMGDQGHAAAVKKANSVYREVRRALGYQTTTDVRF